MLRQPGTDSAKRMCGEGLRGGDRAGGKKSAARPLCKGPETEPNLKLWKIRTEAWLAGGRKSEEVRDQTMSILTPWHRVSIPLHSGLALAAITDPFSVWMLGSWAS